MYQSRIRFCFILALFMVTAGAVTAGSSGPAIEEEKLVTSGLLEPVEIIRDHWGISHIYAKNQPDLFFAQGFNVARDRLFQLEMWRRQATGTLAEILGKRALKQDIGLRLLKARVDIKKEMNHYHSQGEEIITAFVKGINAYIDLTQAEPARLPLEFKLLGIQPQHWTPEIVFSRHNGLYRNARYEIAIARTLAKIGREKSLHLLDLHPGKPKLNNHLGQDISLISNKILALYNASRSSINFLPADIADPKFRAVSVPDKKNLAADDAVSNLITAAAAGSNNWVIAGRLTKSGLPFMANDPHRRQQIPSLRYWVHLHAPGWNVIGGGEPCLPGVSIGHNEHGAWGLTIFSTDQEDLYVYQTDPENPNRYQYKGNWENMRIISEVFKVKGGDTENVDMKYTRHGPVIYEDKQNSKAYALRAAWLEIGGAPYLASLRMDQAATWEEFRDACTYSYTPSENMVWADRKGNIGWQAVGITPSRKGWEGLLPVPGDGSFEWNGYLPTKSLPHVYNPPEGYFSTANQDNVPTGYPYVIGFMWADPFRQNRIQEVLGSGRKFSLDEMQALQHDVVSLPARTLVPLLKNLKSPEQDVQFALERLLTWDYKMRPESIAAAIYQSWQRRLYASVWSLYLTEDELKVFPRRSLSKTISFLLHPDKSFGPDEARARDKMLLDCLAKTVIYLKERLGPDPKNWQYGQTDYHHIKISHPFNQAVNKELRAQLNIGPAARGGNGNTVNQTSSTFNQTSGASFRIIADLSDWDNSLGTNNPGQSGDPNSPHYQDLFNLWVQGKYFPIYFTRSKVETAAEQSLDLVPKKEKR